MCKKDRIDREIYLDLKDGRWKPVIHPATRRNFAHISCQAVDECRERNDNEPSKLKVHTDNASEK